METNNYKWWELEDEKAAKSMDAVVNAILNDGESVHLENMRNLRLYTNNIAGEYTASSYLANRKSIGKDMFGRDARLNWNVVKAAIDSLVAKIAKEKIRPSFLTSGSWIEQQKKSEDLNDWLFGLYSEIGVYTQGKQIFKDACIFGTGAAYVYIEQCKKTKKHKIKFERVMVDEIVVDPFDGYYGRPQALYRLKFVPKQQLLDWGMKISDVAQIEPIKAYGRAVQTSETVQVVEGWRLPTAESKGKRILQASGFLIAEEELEDDCFPFVFFRFNEDPCGFFGTGVSQELLGDQIEINRILNFIKDSMMLVSNPRVYTKIGSMSPKQLINNKIGGVVEYAGDTPPQIYPSQAVSADVFNHLQSLWNKAYEKIGLNELQISGRNQLGAGASGVALREHNDIQSERFATVQQAWEQWHCDLAKVCIAKADEIEKLDGNFEISMSSMDKGTIKLSWKDIKPETDSYTTQVFPRSALPKTPSARLQYVAEMQAKGLIDTEESKELLDFPDLKSKQMLSEYTNLRRIIEKIATQQTPKEGEDWMFISPEPYMNLKYAIKLGKQYYNFLLAEMPEENEDQVDEKTMRLDLVRKFIDEATNMMAPPEQPMTQAPMPGGEMMTPPPEMMGAAPTGMPTM